MRDLKDAVGLAGRSRPSVGQPGEGRIDAKAIDPSCAISPEPLRSKHLTILGIEGKIRTISQVSVSPSRTRVLEYHESSDFLLEEPQIYELILGFAASYRRLEDELEARCPGVRLSLVAA